MRDCGQRPQYKRADMMKYALYSDPGDRVINEDAIGHRTAVNGECFAVCDGLGGHSKGEVASRLAARTAVEQFRQLASVKAGTKTILETIFLESQKAVLRYQKENRDAADMKTTMVVLVRCGEELQWGHVGDSRLYRFAAGRLEERTADHSVPQVLVSCGELKEEQIRFHPDRNRLLRAVGTVWNSPRYELGRPVPARKGEAFLLCTDGFWEWVTERQMEQTLSEAGSPEEWLSAMLKLIPEKHSGSNLDNYSAAAVFVS